MMLFEDIFNLNSGAWRLIQLFALSRIVHRMGAEGITRPRPCPRPHARTQYLLTMRQFCTRRRRSYHSQ